MIVTEPEPEIIFFSQQEFTAKNKMPGQVIEEIIVGSPLLVTEKENSFFGVRVVVEDIPTVEVPVNNRKTEWQVAQLLRDSRLQLDW